MQFYCFDWLSSHAIWAITPWLNLKSLVHLFCVHFKKTIIPYEMNIVNSALCASLVIYHLISNVCSWNNCKTNISADGAVTTGKEHVSAIIWSTVGTGSFLVIIMILLVYKWKREKRANLQLNKDVSTETVSSWLCLIYFPLKNPSQPRLCFCLHTGNHDNPI